MIQTYSSSRPNKMKESTILHKPISALQVLDRQKILETADGLAGHGQVDRAAKVLQELNCPALTHWIFTGEYVASISEIQEEATE